MTIAQLKKNLAEGKLEKVYLFYGEERFLLEQYTAKLREMAVTPGLEAFNLFVFEDKAADFRSFSEAVAAYPQMAERKLIIAKYTDFLTLTEYQKPMLSLIEELTEDTVLLFVEGDGKKIKKNLMTAIEKQGAVVDFPIQKPSDIRAWANRRIVDGGKKMTAADIDYLIQLCGKNMQQLATEIDKLIAAAEEFPVIERKLIDRLVQTPQEVKFYLLAEKLSGGQKEEAYRMLKEFKIGKESPPVIISSIYGHYYSLYLFRVSSSGERFLPANRKWLARKLAAESRRHSPEKLREVMRLCRRYDQEIKTGKIDGFTALEIVMSTALQ